MVQQCTMCSNPFSGRCTSCNCSAYCSKECQKADWPIHKILCKQLQNFATPPNASARRGIYFPVDKVTPEFVWVPIEITRGYEYFEIQTYIGTGGGMDASARVSGNVIRSRKRKDLIQLFTRDTFLTDGSLPNRSISGITKGATAFYTWCGGMLAMKVATLDHDSGRYLHMDTVDFRDIVDLLRSYDSSIDISNMSLNREHKGPQSPLENALKQEAAGEDPWLTERFIQRNSGVTCQGVRINCTRDLSARENQKFEAVEVSVCDPIFFDEMTTRISALIGMPVIVRRINTTSNTGIANLAATFLHLNADPQSPTWGGVYPRHWEMAAGSCVVVHAEKEKLSPRHVEVLCSFCQYFLLPLFEEALENPGKPKNEVLRNLTPTSYALFYSGFESGRRTSDYVTTK